MEEDNLQSLADSSKRPCVFIPRMYFRNLRDDLIGFFVLHVFIPFGLYAMAIIMWDLEATKTPNSLGFNK